MIRRTANKIVVEGVIQVRCSSFGEFIIEKRKERGLSARQLAIALGISAVYMCDIEKGRKAAVSEDFTEKLINTLLMNDNETEQMFDLLALAQNSVSADLHQYIMENELVRTALRTAKKNNITDEKWEKFIDEIVRKE